VGAPTRIQLCGQLVLELDGARLEGELRGRQGRLLFAYLVLHRDRPVRRDELVEALWSRDGLPPSGDADLAPPLSRLRKALGPGRIEGRAELRLVLPDDAWVDWEVAHAAARDARAALAGGDARRAWEAAGAAVEIADRGLLPGHEAPWIDERRAEVEDLCVRALEARATAGVRLGGAHLAEAERAARAAVDAAPFRESARVALIEALRAQGNVAEALRAYEDVRVLLRDELGTAPGAALVALHERLLREEGRAPAAATAAAPVAADLVDRDRELAQLEAPLAAAVAGSGRVVVVDGPAGIGKSRLLAELRDRATGAGALALSARGSQLERDFPFGVVHQLFEPALADPQRRERALDGAAAPARALFAGDDAPAAAGDGDASFAVLHGLYWMALNLAADGPLVLAFDDLHWSDVPSLRFAAYLARRIEGLPILLAAGVRSGEPPTDAALLAEVHHDPATVSVRPRPLGEAAVATLVRDRLGQGADATFCGACHATTRGNPLLVRQLLSALETDRVTPDGAHADVVRAIGSRAVSNAVLLRLGRLPAEAASVARAVAVLGDGVGVHVVADLAELDEREVATATRILADAEILRREPPLGFVHPLVRDAIYLDLSVAEREVEHGRAAEVLSEAGAPPEHVASHLLHVPPKGLAWVAQVLEQAGVTARRQGAAESARAFLRRALDEPPPAARRSRLLLELGLVEAITFAPAVPAHLREALDGLDDPSARATAAHVLGRVLLMSGDPAGGMEVVDRVAADIPDELGDDRRTLEAFALAAVFWGAGDRERLAALASARAGIDDRGAGARMLEALAALDWAYTGGAAADCAALAQRALADGTLIATDPGFITIASLIVLVLADAPDALDAWERPLAEAHRHGSLFAVSGMRSWKGFMLLRRGELLDAERVMATAAEEFNAYGYAISATEYFAGFRAATLVERGDLAGARAVLAAAGTPALGSDGARFWHGGRLELLAAEGRDEELIAAADEVMRHYAFLRNPAAAPWRSLKAQALHRRGRSDEALALVEDELADARRWGAPATVGRALRVLGTIGGGIEPLEEAVAVLKGSPARLEHAKALAALGAASHVAGRSSPARELLARAHDIARVCGAVPLAATVAADLLAAGGRPPLSEPTGAGALTALERRVAVLAAEGRSDREIAQVLYATPGAVVAQLDGVRRKLAWRSPEELAEALAAS
jgi:DNA-binding SARP family transcriptional activator/tetratricopeptide (TPR) repeat protein/DNA-binding CsgD family transcriptional regulator